MYKYKVLIFLIFLFCIESLQTELARSQCGFTLTPPNGQVWFFQAEAGGTDKHNFFIYDTSGSKITLNVQVSPAAFILDKNQVTLEPNSNVSIEVTFKPSIYEYAHTITGTMTFTDIATGCEEANFPFGKVTPPLKGVELETQTKLQIYISPNPASSHATITYSLPHYDFVKLDLCDALGRTLRTFATGNQDAGEHSVNAAFDGLADGMYFVRLNTPNGNAVEKIIINK